jgi:hypothetical protein
VSSAATGNQTHVLLAKGKHRAQEASVLNLPADIVEHEIMRHVTHNTRVAFAGTSHNAARSVRQDLYGARRFNAAAQAMTLIEFKSELVGCLAIRDFRQRKNALHMLVRNVGALPEIERGTAFSYMQNELARCLPDSELRGPLLGGLANCVGLFPEGERSKRFDEVWATGNSARAEHRDDMLRGLARAIQYFPVGPAQLEAFAKVRGAVLALPEGLRDAPLGALAEAIRHLPETRQRQAFLDVRVAVDHIPENLRHEPLTCLGDSIQDLPEGVRREAFDSVLWAVARLPGVQRPDPVEALTAAITSLPVGEQHSARFELERLAPLV